MPQSRQILLGILTAAFVTGPAAGQLGVGSGSALDLGTGTLDLGCSSLVVAGTFDAASGNIVQALDVVIAFGGTLNGGSGTLEVTGDWDNGQGGTFAGGSAAVNLVDGCGRSAAVISGSTSFATLTATSSTSKIWELEAGSTQTIASALSVTGIPSTLLRLRSTSPGVAANLVVTGDVSIDSVEIQDIHAGPGGLILGPNSIAVSNVSGLEICGDLDGNLAVGSSDVAMAREHLMGRAIAGDVTLCNVVGSFDPSESGADCQVDDIFALERLVAGRTTTAENLCMP